MAVKILFDSASDIGQKEAEALGAVLLPMEIRWEDAVYRDGVTLSPSAFFEKLPHCHELPVTSQINAHTFEEAFAREVKAGNRVIAIVISSGLSGTCHQAMTAAASFPGQVFVVDSRNASVGERLLCELALRLADEGRTAEDIVCTLEKARKRIHVIAALDTLKYLKKGGRISALTAFAGEIMAIKPVIGVVEGKVTLLGKAIGSKKSNNLLNALVEKAGGVDYSLPYTVAWSGLDNTLLLKYIQDSAPLWEGKVETIPAHMIGSTIGTHIGPGAVGVAFFAPEAGENEEKAED